MDESGRGERMDTNHKYPSAATPQPTITNGLYAIRIEMRDGKRGRATGVVTLFDGRILGGDSYFYYTGSYTCQHFKWRGELITHQHTEATGVNLAFAGREVTCGFAGSYS